jgi:hypothetical protein
MNTKNCVACAEPIQESAKLCKHCGVMQNDERFVDISSRHDAKEIPVEGVLASDANRTICSACGEVNSKSVKRCVRCDSFLDHENGEFYLTAEAAKVRAEASATSSGSVYIAQAGAETPGIAIAAIVCAFLIPILGLILGYSARSEIRASKGAKGGDGLATGAIVIGWLWIFVLIVWIWIVSVAAANAASELANLTNY